MQLFVTCPKGIEDLLFAELEALGAEQCRQTIAGVSCQGHEQLAYNIILRSRLANRVLWVLDKSPVNSSDSLYSAVKALPWQQWLNSSLSLTVDFSGSHVAIKHTQFGAQRVKDAIVDYWREKGFERPNVDRQNPDYRVNARLHKAELTLSLDLTGFSLHERGYRLEQGAAPLKENLAAAILLRAGWQEIAATGGALCDPMCGSGTLLMEGALIAADAPIGAMRARSYSFENFTGFDVNQWRAALTTAKEQWASGLNNLKNSIVGFDQHGPVLTAALNNAKRIGISDKCTFTRSTIENVQISDSLPKGLVITNPPYGARLGEVEALKETYHNLANQMKVQFSGWKLGVFTGNPELAQHMRLRANKKNKLFNGAIACELHLFDVLDQQSATLREGEATAARPEVYKMTDGAQMVANRLKKNQKALAKWLKTAPTNAYRLYDADMPEYSAAIDFYDGRLHIQEYAPPKKVDMKAAASRFKEIIAAVCDVFECEPSDLSIKTRERLRGTKQYEKAESSADDFVVTEGKAKLWVNLHKYLDTGLFLDHRPLRLRIGEEAQGKRFLNLFAYTATASVHAALGGASRTVSVDMSKTYLSWAERNFELNHIHSNAHECVQSDVFKYLQNVREGFDLIMLDPPSFSNSKRMDDVLDIQRDHVKLIKRCLDILSPNGVLYFSNNLRTFKLDYESLPAANIDDITEQTIDIDFARNRKIHQCFRITHKKR